MSKDPVFLTDKNHTVILEAVAFPMQPSRILANRLSC